MSITDDKECRRCHLVLPAEHFRIVIMKNGNSILSSSCNDCERQRSLNKSLKTHLWTDFRMSIEEYEMILKSQNGVCAICGQPETSKDANGKTKRLAVDHCHKEGINCGLLCSCCNIGIGMFQNDFKRILGAAEYVRRTRPWLL